MDLDYEELRKISQKLRATIVEMSHRSGAPHLGSSLSCIDALVSLYWSVLRIDPKKPTDPERDRFILSKGHAASALYVTLAERGFFDRALLEQFCVPGKNLPEQPSPGCAPGVEWATGSLGHGLSVGIGMALSAKIAKTTYKVFCLLSDGECNEGSVWEAALFAPKSDLDNLTIIVDYNKWQATGRSQEVMSLEPLHTKWASFGWDALEVDGHNHKEIVEALTAQQTKPRAIITHTIKGKGVSFMEDDNNWHYRIPTADEVLRAKEELS